MKKLPLQFLLVAAIAFLAASVSQAVTINVPEVDSDEVRVSDIEVPDIDDEDIERHEIRTRDRRDRHYDDDEIKFRTRDDKPSKVKIEDDGEIEIKN
ncbi:MAG: hypothetical protein ACRC2R_03530 [Xenococcaceae cyanobacterium]